MARVSFLAAGATMLMSFACRHSPPSGVVASAVDELMAPADGMDLSGNWMIGSGREPDSAVVRLNLPCLYHPAAWVLQQNGNSLEAYSFPESHDQGAASREPMRATVPMRGKISGRSIRLDADSTHYRLQFDSASGHLRGTLNGKPIWAVRRLVVYPGVCLPPA